MSSAQVYEYCNQSRWCISLQAQISLNVYTQTCTHIYTCIGVGCMCQVIKAQIMICQSPSLCPAALGRCPGLSGPYWSEPEEKLVWGNLCSFWKRTQLSAGQRLVRLKSFADSIAKWCLARCRRGETNLGFLCVKWIIHVSLVQEHRDVWDQPEPTWHMLGLSLGVHAERHPDL